MKTKIYLIIFAILAFLAGYTLYNNSLKSNDEKEKEFKVENFEDVTEINITDRVGKKMNLKKIGDSWILNDKFPVRMHLFNEVKDALTKMEAVSPVPNIGKKTIIEQMVAEAIKVQVYKGKKLDKTIYIGGPNLQNTASHMFLEINGKAAKQIYNVAIPGFRGYLTTRFVVNEKEWRSKDIFSYSPQDIKKLEIKYFNYAQYDNFKLYNNNNNYSVEIDGKVRTGDDINMTNMVNYLKSFENQQVVSYAFDLPEDKHYRDSIFLSNKYAEFNLEDAKGNKMEMTIIDMPLNESSKQQYDDKGDPMAYDVDYKYIVFGDKKDWGVITNSKFGILLISPYLLLTNNIKE